MRCKAFFPAKTSESAPKASRRLGSIASRAIRGCDRLEDWSLRVLNNSRTDSSKAIQRLLHSAVKRVETERKAEPGTGLVQTSQRLAGLPELLEGNPVAACFRCQRLSDQTLEQFGEGAPVLR